MTNNSEFMSVVWVYTLLIEERNAINNTDIECILNDDDDISLKK